MSWSGDSLVTRSIKPFQGLNDLLVAVHTNDTGLKASLSIFDSVGTLAIPAASTSTHESGFDSSHVEPQARLCYLGTVYAVKSRHAYPASLVAGVIPTRWLMAESILPCEGCALAS